MEPVDPSQSPGRIIARAADIILRTATEWHGAMRALRDELAALNAYVCQENGSPRRQEAPLWLHASRSYHFEVYSNTGGRGRRRQFGSYTVVLELNGDGTLADALGQPVVQIGWSSWGDSWEGGWITLPSPNAGMHLYQERVFVWHEENARLPDVVEWKQTPWIYAFPLERLSERADVRRLMIDPVLSILDGKSVQEAFKRQPEVLRFRSMDGALELLREAH